MALKPQFPQAPLTFDEDEVDELILGLCFVMQRGDAELEQAAESALARIEAALPRVETVRAAALPLAGRGESREAGHLSTIDTAIQAERKLRLSYTDRKGRASERVIWPVALDPYGTGETLAAWCETRSDFRHSGSTGSLRWRPRRSPCPSATAFFSPCGAYRRTWRTWIDR